MFKKTVVPAERSFLMTSRTSCRPNGSNALGRFVQDDQLRMAQEGNAQPKALLHPFGERTDLVVAPF